MREVRRLPNRLPPDDDHPYRTGAWRPNFVEWDAEDLEVVEGRLPRELDGVYLRNTENPVMPSIGRYHPFDGDGMLHAISLRDGRASYRSRFVPTAGLTAELEAGEPLWAGIIEPPARSRRDGWGARTRLKDASSTDVVVHAGRAVSTFYQCGDAYLLDPITLEAHGTAAWAPPGGVSAHPKVDPRTGELLYFGYAARAPFAWFGVVDRHGRRTLHQEIPLPGPRLPHDIAFTERFVVFPDLPLFWDPDLIAQGTYRARWRPDLPSRFGVVSRAGGEVRWFEAAPTYVLHFANAYERGHELIVDGYFQEDPTPRPDPADGAWAALKKMVDMNAMKTRLHRWRLDLSTGRTTEERLFEPIHEFPSIHTDKPGVPNRYVWAMTGKPGWFLFDGLMRLDLETGRTQRFAYPDGVYASEAPMAPRPGARDEDDGWVLTFVSDVGRDRSECHVFHAAHLEDGPVARLALPERISAGTHACWAPRGTLA